MMDVPIQPKLCRLCRHAERGPASYKARGVFIVTEGRFIPDGPALRCLRYVEPVEGGRPLCSDERGAGGFCGRHGHGFEMIEGA